MLESVLTQMKGAYDSYWTSKRSEWIMKWCGQFVQTVSRTTWVKEVHGPYYLSLNNAYKFLDIPFVFYM